MSDLQFVARWTSRFAITLPLLVFVLHAAERLLSFRRRVIWEDDATVFGRTRVTVKNYPRYLNDCTSWRAMGDVLAKATFIGILFGFVASIFAVGFVEVLL